MSQEKPKLVYTKITRELTPVDVCPHCDEEMPHGDRRLSWLDHHESWRHKAWWRARKYRKAWFWKALSWLPMSKKLKLKCRQKWAAALWDAA